MRAVVLITAALLLGAPEARAADAPQLTAAAARDLAAQGLSQDQPISALVWAQKAAQLDPGDGAAKRIEGAALARLGRHDEAYAAFAAAAALRPDDLAAHLGFARAALMLNRPDRAEAGFTEALRLAPGLQAAWEGRAAARSAMGDGGGADADLQAALRLEQIRARQARIDAEAADIKARIEAR